MEFSRHGLVTERSVEHILREWTGEECMMMSASLVLYNTDSKYIEKVISSYRPCKNRFLFIIDNSRDESYYCKEIVSDFIYYIKNDSNIGYGAAHNIGIKKAIALKTKYHLVLNPDVRFKSEILDELVDYAEKNEDVNCILPKVIYPNGEIQYLCKLLPTPFDLIFRRFFPQFGMIKKRNDRYILKNSGYDKIMNPPCLSGCFMFLKTKILDQYELLFDEKFFMYCEDFDLVRRLHRVGKTIYYPYVTIEHDYAQGSYKDKKLLLMHIKSAYLYFNKYGWLFDKERKEQNRIITENIKLK